MKKTGGFSPYQKTATFMIISSFVLYYSQFFCLNFLLFEPDYQCLEEGQWHGCNRETACEAGPDNYRFAYDVDKESYFNWYEWLDLTCKSTKKIKMIPIAFVIGNCFAQITSPFQVKVAGLKGALLINTAAQALITLALVFTRSLDLVICIVCLLGLTGGR